MTRVLQLRIIGSGSTSEWRDLNVPNHPAHELLNWHDAETVTMSGVRYNENPDDGTYSIEYRFRPL
jgi:hypothetical protein